MRKKLDVNAYVLLIAVFASFCDSETLLEHNAVKDVEERIETGLDNKLSPENVASRTNLKLGKEDTRTCMKDGDCYNGGTCEGDRIQFCSCKNGTSGDYCEIVDECVSLCGNGTDVTCEYDQVKEKAVCRCHNESKKFDHDSERCRVPCKNFCKYGYCLMVAEGLKFCYCQDGISGDKCEIIDQCESKEVDCGDDPNVECAYTYAKERFAYCRCSDWRHIFDYDRKICRACYCGLYSSSCSFEKEEKKCHCYTPYKQNGEKCEECDCGSRSVDCEFIYGEKKCTCLPGFVQDGGHCIAACNATLPCRNGGVCDRVCHCKTGTKGDFCEVIDFCLSKPCGWQAKCLYDEKKEQGYCSCDSNLTFDPYNKICRVCDCGANGNCSFIRGSKECSCIKKYEHSAMTGKCERCYCGDNGTCRRPADGTKKCSCTIGYSEKSGMCEECSCGTGGRCYFEGEKKKCDCYSHYKERFGVCEECFCGYFGFCEFKNSTKTCVCNAQYGENNGICVACNCNLNANCTFFNDGIKTKKSCICPEGYEDDSGICRDIDECIDPLTCPPKSTECSNIQGSYECYCRSGYLSRGKDKDPKIYGCEEINRCHSYMCGVNTRCVNIGDSYKCVCLNGYVPMYSDPEYGCTNAGPWKIGYTFLIVFFGFVSIFLIILIIVNRRKRRRLQVTSSRAVLYRAH